MSEAGYVYVAKHETKPATFKIGRTSDIRQRDSALQGGAPGKPIKIVEHVLVDDMHAVEKALHAMLKQALLKDEREWFNIELDQVTPMLALIRRWCATPSATNLPTQERSQRAHPKGNRRGWWHEEGWKMHCEGATQAAIASKFEVSGPTVGAMIKKMRDADRGHEERTRPKPKHGIRRVRSRAPTPQASYLPAIVNVLKRLGGRGRVRDVLSGVEKEVSLSQADWEKHRTGAVIWKNNAQWARQRLKDEGILRSDSPYGWWELA